jgi:hypothetical protein
MKGPRSLIQHERGIPQLRQLAAGGVGCSSEVVHCFEELFALAEEEPIGGEACNRSHSSSKRIGQRTNDRALGEFGIDEFARDGKDQARLNQAGRLQRWVCEKIWKRQALVRHRCCSGCTAFPAKSTHSRKWATSSPPMPRVISTTSRCFLFDSWLRKDSSHLAQSIRSEMPLYSRSPECGRRTH